MKDTDLDRFGELSGTAQIAVARLVNMMASLGTPDDATLLAMQDIVDYATSSVRDYGRQRVSEQIVGILLDGEG